MYTGQPPPSVIASMQAAQQQGGYGDQAPARTGPKIPAGARPMLPVVPNAGGGQRPLSPVGNRQPAAQQNYDNGAPAPNVSYQPQEQQQQAYPPPQDTQYPPPQSYSQPSRQVPSAVPGQVHTTPTYGQNPDQGQNQVRNMGSAAKRASLAQHVPQNGEDFDTNFYSGVIRGAVDDMVLLTDISNDGVVKNLYERYSQDRIYTYIGPVLISINPYKRMPDVGPETMSKYEGTAQHDITPHVYAVADRMYRRMMEDSEAQCVIISGESGAGKTEASKLIMNHIAHVSGGGSGVDHVKQVILESNPVLEAFGNAKTLRNNNSSRFGKYFEILFDAGGCPSGGLITNFLLEKSRVVGGMLGERSFHIFYQVLYGASAQEKAQYKLWNPQDYLYLASTQCYTVDGTDDVQEFAETRHAMDVIGVNPQTQQDVLRAIASVLHIGNVTFVEGGKGAQPQSMEYLQIAAESLGVDTGSLAKKLTSRLMTTGGGGGGKRGSTYEVPFQVIGAEAARDSLAKSLYSRLFDWIVESINLAIQMQTSSICISVLDIYGFEIFEKNGFEQFCINYVNEKLQQIFIELTLQQEQDEYIAEGIQWTPIQFFNNKVVCELIEGRRPAGLMAVLDDVCKTMYNETSGVDEKFIQKAQSAIQHQHFQPRGRHFTIKHYAGDVSYDSEGFTEKNKDVLFKDIIQVMQSSNNGFMRSLFPDTFDDDRKAPSTAGFKIFTQANNLVKKLKTCQPHYVRCIKPNENKAANDWDTQRCVHQVKYLGLLENVRVRRAGFAYRGEFTRFMHRYHMCHRSTKGYNGDPRRGCELLLQSLGVPQEEWRMGKSKMFIKSPETLFGLDDLRERTMNHYAGKIQRFYRRNGSPAMRKQFAEAVQFWATMRNTFSNIANDPYFGKYVEWPQYPQHLTATVNWSWAIFQNWRAMRMVTALTEEQALALRQKVVAYDIFHGKKPWAFNRDYVGNHLASPQFNLKHDAYIAAERMLIQQHQQRVVIFSDKVSKINKVGKAQDRALIVTDTHFFKYDPGNLKIKKYKIPLTAVQSVSMSTRADSFVFVHMAAPERDIVIDLCIDGHNKVAEFVTMLYQAYFMMHKRAIQVTFSDQFSFNNCRTPKGDGKVTSVTFAPETRPKPPIPGRCSAIKKNNDMVVYYPSA